MSGLDVLTVMTAFKLVRLRKDGTVGPLFIDRGFAPEVGPRAVWYRAKFNPTKGFVERRGWHCTARPVAPHLSMRLKTGERRVWAECRVACFRTYSRPESQGGTWILADRIKFVKIRKDLGGFDENEA